MESPLKSRHFLSVTDFSAAVIKPSPLMSDKPLIVVALGGNAISTPDEEGNVGQQFANSAHTARQLADLVEAGNQLVITHGNGPQIGNFMLRNKVAALGLVSRFDAICFTADGGRAWHKPSPLPFLSVLRQLDRPAHQVIYVGDNPRTDARGALMVGMRPIRLRKFEGGLLHCVSYLHPSLWEGRASARGGPSLHQSKVEP